ncbi:WD repeat-containing protein 88 [Erinaceus europaeus]|uniref:WD repeat-containing protein 88 n=1 Tax=Erinaceus europaeus TaxID=9365 RepID=A0A1S3AS42_ERIEU|nr:WD repeat-containing protein 88 [Erinaceus europaeus]
MKGPQKEPPKRASRPPGPASCRKEDASCSKAKSKDKAPEAQKNRSLDSTDQTRRLSLLAALKAYGRLKLSIVEKRQARLQQLYDPLTLDKDMLKPEKENLVPEKTFWGDQEPLSKIPFKLLKGHQHTVNSCHFCVEDTKILSGSYDCSLLLWDAMEGTVIRDFQAQHRAPIFECSITADNRRVIAGSYDKKVNAWDFETGQLLWEMSHDTLILSCKISPDGKYVVSCLDVDRGICVSDAESTATLSHIKDYHEKSITACCFDPDSQRVASVSLDRNIKIWDVSSQAAVLTITKAHTNAISNCCFTSSGHFLCTSSWDKTLKIWNVHTGEFRHCGACVTLMKGHEGCVSSCHFSRDTSVLASGGYDRAVVIWDVAEGYKKLSLKGHDDWVTDIAISANKKWLLSASKDKTMKLWNIEELDQIPQVIENKKALGLKIGKCKVCDRPFSNYESDIFSDAVTKCALCRMNETSH